MSMSAESTIGRTVSMFTSPDSVKIRPKALVLRVTANR